MQQLTRTRLQFFVCSKVEDVALSLHFSQGVCVLWRWEKSSSRREGFGCLPKRFPSSSSEVFGKVEDAASIVRRD